MATKEQPQPTNVAQPEMPMQPNAYQSSNQVDSWNNQNRQTAVSYQFVSCSLCVAFTLWNGF